MILGVVLFAIGVFLLILVHKNKYEETKLYFMLFLALSSLFLSSYLMFSDVSLEIIRRKALGFVLGGLGFLLTFIYPTTSDYQPVGMSYAGVFIGVLLLIGGIVMILF